MACQALSAALASGVRRRSLVHMTPLVAGPGKRPLRKSPETVASTASPATTTSPDPKRLMTESSSSEKASGCGPPPVRDDVVLTQLFGADGPSPGECLQGCHIYIFNVYMLIYIYYKENFKNNINVNICVYFMMT